MGFSRSTIAVAAVLAALGALAAVALAGGGEPTTTSAPAPTAETDPPVQVRTKVIRRTVHVRPKAAASSDDDGTADQGPGDAPRTPVPPAAPAAPAAPVAVSDDDDHFDDDDSGHGRGRGRGRGGDDDD